ncbi:cytochrome b [Pseudomonas aeruginosa]|nr:cytochrome b [Pseudomonas aeruginosa]
MQWRNTSSRYGVFSLFLHWGSALVVFGLFGLGLWMRELSYYDPWYHPAPALHKSIGILLAIALLVRIVLAFRQPAAAGAGQPRSAHAGSEQAWPPRAVRAAAGGDRRGLPDFHRRRRTDQRVRLVLRAGNPQRAARPGRRRGEIHLYLAWALVVFAVLHALAALKHHFVDRDPTLKRMLGRSSNDQQPR